MCQISAQTASAFIQPHFVSLTPLRTTGACTFYNELDVDDGYSFQEAMDEKTKRLKDLEEGGAEQRQLDRVRAVLVGSHCLSTVTVWLTLT